MAHVAQILDGRFNFTKTKKVWMGKDMSKCPYKESPWELDAYDMEDYLYKFYDEGSKK